MLDLGCGRLLIALYEIHKLLLRIPLEIGTLLKNFQKKDLSGHRDIDVRGELPLHTPTAGLY